MARKRMIDPDSWTDDKLADLSMCAHLLWIGLVSHADDDGRIEWNARQFKFRLFSAKAEATIAAIEGWMAEVAVHGAVVVYAVDGKHYAYHPSWKKHQYVNKPAKSKIPDPPTAFDPQQRENDGDNGRKEAPQEVTTFPKLSRKMLGNVVTPQGFAKPPVPLESESESESESSAPDGAGRPAGSLVPFAKPTLSRDNPEPEPPPKPRPTRDCSCGESPSFASDDPVLAVDDFLAAFANCRSDAARRRPRPVWIGWLREMQADGHDLDAIWTAFAAAHADARHAPLHDSRSAWSALRLATRPPRRTAIPEDPLPPPFATFRHELEGTAR